MLHTHSNNTNANTQQYLDSHETLKGVYRCGSIIFATEIELNETSKYKIVFFP